MAIDFSVFGNAKSLIDMQQLQAAFEAKKAQEALQTQALIQQASGQLSPKDQMAYQLQLAQFLGNREDKAADREQRAQVAADANDTRRLIAEGNNQQKAAALQAQQDKVADKLNMKRSADQNLLNNALQANNEQLALIESVRNAPGLAKNFGTLGMLPNIPGGEAADALAQLRKLDARSFVNAVGNMKSQSATGASGLGALSEREGDKVQASAAATQTSQSFEGLNKSLDDYANELKASNQRLINGFNNIYGQGQQQVPAPSIAEGTVQTNRRTGQTRVFTNGQWVVQQ